jgi:hypothetical protein
MRNTLRILLCSAIIYSDSLSAADNERQSFSKNSYTTENLKVEKVFNAKDGDTTFRAYLVKWENQEVIVTDTISQSDYQVGDTMPVIVMKHYLSKEKNKSGLLGFEIGAPIRPISKHLKTGVAGIREAKNEEERFYHLGRAAKELFEQGKIQEATQSAKELLQIAESYKGNWNYGNAIQDGNLVLGRIAVRDGKIDIAKSYLVAASKSPGSPQMDSFGPNVSLAKDLLEKGEIETVINYFTACKVFWKLADGKLDTWIAVSKEGKIPVFGANLLY